MALDQAPHDFHGASHGAQLWFAAWLGSRASFRLTDNAADETPRARFDGSEFYLPQNHLAHHRAGSAHFYAHQRFGGAPFSTGRLRPIQIVLVSLFEDARVEQLALRSRPGLRRLWQPYIDALDTDGGDVPALLRRLTQALFDPASPQIHPWIETARRRFYERRDEWNDPALSRELGNWLGNDIGQMRLQFNWKNYVVEPAYRDDHRGLWNDDDDPQPLDAQKRAGIRIDGNAMAIAAAPVADNAQARATEAGAWLAAGANITAAAVRLPEWDYARQFYRNDWVSVREHVAPSGGSAPLLRSDAIADRTAPIENRFPATRRHRRACDGDTLDIDACIRLFTDRQLGNDADLRIHRRRVNQAAPRSIVILLDTSLSMGAVSSLSQHSAATCLDRAKMAAMDIVRHAQASGDRIAIYGFCSDGRHALRMALVKKFGELQFAAHNSEWLGRLVGLAPAYSTRLGGALRYARQLFDDEINSAREIIVIGDGEVGDIDVIDPQYLYEDAHQAVRELQRSGVQLHYCNVIERKMSTQNDRKLNAENLSNAFFVN